MAIEFTCPSCDATLRAQESFAGRKSRCPHCGEPMRVPDLAAAEDVFEREEAFEEVDDSFSAPLPSGSRTGGGTGNAMEDFLSGGGGTSRTRPGASRSESPPPPVTEDVTCAVCGTRNDPADEACRGCGEPMRRQLAPGFGEDGEITPTVVGFQEVFQSGWDVFSNKIGPCIGGFVISTILMLVGFGVGFGVVAVTFAAVGIPINAPVAITILVLTLLMLSLVVSFLFAGQLLFFAAIARGDEADFGLLFRGWPFAGRVMIVSIAYMLLVLVGLLLFVVPGIVIAVVYFPAVYVLVDRDVSVGEAMSTASEITKGNRMMLFLILLAAWAMNLAAQVLQGLGYLIVTPFLTTLYLVAYRMMAGLPVPEGD